MTRHIRHIVVVCLAAVLLALIDPSTFRAQGQSGSFEPLTLQSDRAYFSQLPFESIDAVTGNLVLSFTDLVLPGNGGMGISIVRTMNNGGANGPAWTIAPAGIPIAVEGMTAPPTGPRMVGVMTGDRGRRRVPHQTGVDTYVLDNFMRVTLSTRTVELPNGWIATYESTAGVLEAQLQEVHDAFGNSVTATWLARPPGGVTATNISQLVLQGGGDPARTVFFTYNAAGTELEQLQSEGRTWTYGWSAGKLTSATPPAGPAWQFSYGASNLTVTTPHGGTATYNFQQMDDGQGHLHPAVTSRSVGGRDVPAGNWTFEYYRHINPMMTIVNSPDGRHLGYRHQATTDPAGGTYWKLVQKTLHRGQAVLSRLDLTYVNCGDGFEPMVNDLILTQEGRTYTKIQQYNAAGTQRCDMHRPKQITETGDLTRTTAHTFHYPSQVYRGDLISSTTVTSGSQSLTTNYAYNAQGFMTSQTTLGVQTTYAPSGAGNLASVTNANNQTTSFSYEWGSLKNTQTPLYSISRSINSTGTVASETRRDIQTAIAYDPLGRIVSVSAPGVETVTTAYQPESVSVTQGPSVVTREFDGFGRTRRVFDNLGVSSTTQYDAEGRAINQTAPSDASATANDTFVYDDFGRVTSVTHSGGGVVTTSYTGTSVTVTDENNRTTTQHFALFGPGDGRLTSVVDPAGQSWQYGYNGFGSLTSVAQPGGTARSFTYDAFNRLATETHPESGTTTYAYDNLGQLTTKQDARGTVFTYTHDANGRLTGIAGLGSDSVTMGYDESDNRTSLVNSGVASTFAYDSANRVTSRTDVMPGATFTTGYIYDSRGNLTRITYPSGRMINYAYDAGNRVTQVSDGGGQVYASGLNYHPAGPLRALTFGNGTAETATFDARYRLGQLSSGPLGLTYAYDPGGNVTSVTDTRPDRSSSFSYDALDRLRFVTGFGADEYQYDALGNRVWEANGNVSSTYNGNLRLAQTTGTFGTSSYTYDNGGNLQTSGPDTFEYTPFNRMRAATVGGVQSSYSYDGDNQRVVRIGPGGTTYSISGAGSQVLAEYEFGGTGAVLVREYVYLGAKLVASTGRPAGAAPTASVALTSPAQGATFTQGTTVTITAQPTVTAGTVARVEFYSNGWHLGDDTTAPYSYDVAGFIAADHGLVARVITSNGVVASSAVVVVTVTPPNAPPTVTLTSPAQGSTYTALATIEVAATATAAQGSIASVAFYYNGHHLSTDTTAPYAYTWPGVNSGTFSITAVATDTTGATATSSPISVTINTPPSTVLTVVVTPNPVTAGQSATVTVGGGNPCTMLHMDFGDGDWWIAPISGLPFTTTKTWATPGNYLVYAAGYSTCGGEAARWVTVNGADTDSIPVTVVASAPERSSAWQNLPINVATESPLRSFSRRLWSGLDGGASEPSAANGPPTPDTSSGDRADLLDSGSPADHTVFIDINGTGSGTVSGSATCTGTSTTCAVLAPESSFLTLTATPHAGMTFTGWTGACWHSNPTCTVFVWEHRFTAANFTAATSMVTSYYHLDGLGSVRAVTDAAGAVTERHDYRPFGEDTMPLPAPGSDPARFLGQQRDSTKLDQFGARYYSMFHGRFTSVDAVISPRAVVRPQKWNRYAYARNNPLRFTDSSGFDDGPPPALEPDFGPSPYYLEGSAEWDRWMEEDWLRQRAQYLLDQQGPGGGGTAPGGGGKGGGTPGDGVCGLCIPQVTVSEEYRFKEPQTYEQLLGDIANRSKELFTNLVVLAASVGPLRGTGGSTAITSIRVGQIYRASSFADEALLATHYAKHAAEWGSITQSGYLKRAQSLLGTQPGGNILGHTRATNGDVLRYNVRTNEFAVGAADGTIRTLFRPTDGIRYWQAQIGR